MAPGQHEKLERKLGFWDVFCVAAGAMISSGLFVLPGEAYRQAGPAMILSYALAALFMLPSVLSMAELAAAMPRSGGSYFFIERSMGALPGLLAGLANWFAISLKGAFALIGIGAFARLIWADVGEWTIKAIALVACVGFAALNLFSVKSAGRLQIAMVAVLIAVIVLFIVTDLPNSRHENFASFMSKGLGSMLATAALVFISYGGLTKIASVGGEIRDPARNIPMGMFAAYVVVSLLYVAAVFVVVGVAPPETLYNPATGQVDLTPLCTAARHGSLGTAGMIVLAAGAMLAFFTTANSSILSASRNPMAMSQDNLLPQFMRRVSGRFKTPYVSILLTSLFMLVVIAALSIENLIKVASTMMLMLLLLANAAVIIMRRSRIQNYRPPFRCPLFPWMQLAGIAAYAFLIAEMGRAALTTTAVFALSSAIWYIIYVRARIDRESALVYMVRQAVSSDLYRSELEEELREISLERDEVVHDRFDELIRRCAVLDIQTSVPAEEMFREAAEALGPRMNLPPERIFQLLQAREAASSTVIQPGLAIPHVIVPGEKLFDVLLVRCRDGVVFPNQPVPVQVCFVLAGSADERNYHLRALMAVAHIVQEHDFTRRWLEAPIGEHLKDIILMSKRKRDAD